MNKMDLYYKSPAILQNILMSMGRFYENKKLDIYRHVAEDEIKRSESMSFEELRDDQFFKFKKLLIYSYENIDFYKKLYDEKLVDVYSISSWNDIQKIPCITKKDIQSNYAQMINNEYKKNEQITSHTSGTTGTPLQFITDKLSESYYNEHVRRHRTWNGYFFKGYCASFGGKKIVSTNKMHKLWRWSIPDKLLLFSSFHLTDENVLKYACIMEKRKIKYIKGYSSNLYIVAMILMKHNVTLPMKGVFFGSEPMYDYQREVIEKTFQCKVSNFYGNSERTVFAYDCEKKEGLHVSMDYTLVQICDEDGNEVENGVNGEIIGTNLVNYSMPLIRYRTGDISHKLDKSCSCGRMYEMLERIETKVEDYIIGANGEKISPSALTHPFKPIPMRVIENSQVYQDKIGKICIRIVKGENFSQLYIDQLLAEFKDRFNGSLVVTVEFVDVIYVLDNGKYKWVISKLRN